MKFRKSRDDAFDGLTGDEKRRIRDGAAANVTPGLEGLAPAFEPDRDLIVNVGVGPLRSSDVLPGKPVARKRGRRI